MKKRNILLACGFAIILIGVTAAITFSIAQNPVEEDEGFMSNINLDVLAFDHIDQNVHDIELPETMEFCGEQVPLDRFYVRESLERELMVNTYRHASTILLLKRTTRWFPVIDPSYGKTTSRRTSSTLP